MDAPPPAGADVESLWRALSQEWGLVAGEIRYCPKGGGSYHWVAEVDGRPGYFLTVDDLDTKPWIADRRDPAFDGLARAYGAAWSLRHGAALSFVVAPIRTPAGSVIRRLSDRLSLAVFPFVDGFPGEWGDRLEPAVRSSLIRQLARLHRTPAAGLGPSPLPLGLPGRPALTAAMSDLARPWDGGPLSEPARHALAEHVTEVEDWLAQLDALADRLQRDDAELRVTHGEPHPGNLIRAGDALCLVDWDTVALARPERDLWMLDDGSPAAFALYEDLTGTAVSAEAVAFYRLAWTLSDIASFVHMFRSPHEENRFTRLKSDGLRRLLEGEPSAPFALR